MIVPSDREEAGLRAQFGPSDSRSADDGGESCGSVHACQLAKIYPVAFLDQWSLVACSVQLASLNASCGRYSQEYIAKCNSK